MNVLITAGGTYENIDSIRCITNKATGRLGSIIADTFIRAGSQVTYVCSESAVLPACDCLEIIRINTVAELSSELETLLHANSYDCIIHTMAVSDFTSQAIISVDEAAESISRILQTENISPAEMPDKIRAIIYECGKPLTDNKISSKQANIALLLKQTPKVIASYKSIQPHAILVGFKLLSNVPEEELLQAGFKLLKDNTCDFVIANDFANIKNEMHKGILLDRNGILGRAETKTEIAQMIFKFVSERLTNI